MVFNILVIINLVLIVLWLISIVLELMGKINKYIPMYIFVVCIFIFGLCTMFNPNPTNKFIMGLLIWFYAVDEFVLLYKNKLIDKQDKLIKDAIKVNNDLIDKLKTSNRLDK